MSTWLWILGVALYAGCLIYAVRDVRDANKDTEL